MARRSRARFDSSTIVRLATFGRTCTFGSSAEARSPVELAVVGAHVGERSDVVRRGEVEHPVVGVEQHGLAGALRGAQELVDIGAEWHAVQDEERVRRDARHELRLAVQHDVRGEAETFEAVARVIAAVAARVPRTSAHQQDRAVAGSWREAEVVLLGRHTRAAAQSGEPTLQRQDALAQRCSEAPRPRAQHLSEQARRAQRLALLLGCDALVARGVLVCAGERILELGDATAQDLVGARVAGVARAQLRELRLQRGEVTLSHRSARSLRHPD